MAGENLLAGPRRNFQIFEPLNLLAGAAWQIPEQGQHLIRYYGWYSDEKRGERSKRMRKPKDNGATVRPPRSEEVPENGASGLLKEWLV
jgi:hypothetical protein